MLPVLVNFVVASLFARYAWQALPRSLHLFRVGYWRIHAIITRNKDYERNIIARAAISEAGTYLIGAVMWFSAGCLFTGLAVYFGLQIFAWL